MKKLLFILFILLLTNNMFCLSENEVVKVLREDSLTNHFFNTKNYKYSIQDNMLATIENNHYESGENHQKKSKRKSHYYNNSKGSTIVLANNAQIIGANE